MTRECRGSAGNALGIAATPCHEPCAAAYRPRDPWRERPRRRGEASVPGPAAVRALAGRKGPGRRAPAATRRRTTRPHARASLLGAARALGRRRRCRPSTARPQKRAPQSARPSAWSTGWSTRCSCCSHSSPWTTTNSCVAPVLSSVTRSKENSCPESSFTIIRWYAKRKKDRYCRATAPGATGSTKGPPKSNSTMSVPAKVGTAARAGATVVHAWTSSTLTRPVARQ
mmetsp:Transcript_107089/g.298255  ORF Transcript_107089/g.298255 Transcript_107089/m.298255 type:complete len:228 (+) Transcript_107089:89-772(+)